MRKASLVMLALLFLFPAGRCRSAIIAHYALDETAGTTASDSVGGFDGTLTGMDPVTDWIGGQVGGALDFDGLDDRVALPAINLNSSAMTITAWIKSAAGQNGYTGLVFRRTGSEDASGFGFSGTTNELGYHWNNEKWDWHSGLIVPNGKWVFAAISIGATNAAVYLGDPDSGTLQSAATTHTTHTEQFNGANIGCDFYSGGGRFFNGAIDDARIWNEALTGTQIQAVYDEAIAAVIEFEAASSGGLEAVSPANVAVVLARSAAGQTYTVGYSVTGGTAAAGNDYTLPGSSLTFDSGQTVKQIAITIVDDGVGERDETIELELSGPAGPDVRLGRKISHTYTIIDPRPGVEFESASGSGGEGLAQVQVPVVLSQPLAEESTVDYAVAGGTAVEGTDYVLAGGTLTFEAGGTAGYITIEILDDALDEFPDETIELALSNPSANLKLAAADRYTYTIVDDEYGPVFTNSLGMEFFRIDPGTFTMGIDIEPRIRDVGSDDYDEQPAHLVTLTKRFYMLKTKVTDAVYQQAGIGGSAADASWDNAEAFCSWLSQADGRAYRLPTEAEWQYVCDNPQGVLDMAGREWTADWHGPYSSDYLVDPVGPATGILKVIRGDTSRDRKSLPPSAASSPWGLGAVAFRVVMDIDPPGNPFVGPPPVPQVAVKQSAGPALVGPDPNVPYFTVRFALPIPPENTTNGNASMLGVSAAVMSHNHSPGFEIMPNGDALAVWFSAYTSQAVDEKERSTRFVQARLRYGSEQWDMPDLFYDFKGENDQSGLLWTEDDGTVWFFGGGHWMSDRLPFKIAKSTDSGATWNMVLPLLTSGASDYTAQPCQNAFRSPGGEIYFAMDAAEDNSFLWRSSDAGLTWHDMGGRTSSRHSTIVMLDGTGRLRSVAGKNMGVNDFNIWDKSYDWGATWPESGATPFSELSPNQRPSAIVMANGKLAVCQDAQTHYGNRPPGINHPPGCVVAVSDDDGETWHIKNLPVTLPHEDYSSDWRLGYATIRQAPNGLLHILSTMTHPCLHYELNETWVYSGEGDIPPETSGGTVSQYSENYPTGGLKAAWSARTTPGGRYLLHGTETSYYPGGTIEHEVTYENGRRAGSETYYSPDGRRLWSWQHDTASNTSVLATWWSSGLKRTESRWNSYPQARDLARNFHGFVAEGTSYRWAAVGTPLNAWEFTGGEFIGDGTLPAPQQKTGDLDGDGSSGGADLGVFVENWLWSGPAGGYNIADFDFDGDVDFVDYAIFAGR